MADGSIHVMVLQRRAQGWRRLGNWRMEEVPEFLPEMPEQDEVTVALAKGMASRLVKHLHREHPLAVTGNGNAEAQSHGEEVQP